VIPAQITTVEDKIAGNLSFMQLVLLILPVMLSLLLYALISPVMQLTLIKAAISGIVTVFLVILAIRVKGHILLQWLVMYARYSLRPSYYIFTKQDTYNREVTLIQPPVKPASKSAKVGSIKPTHTPTTTQLLWFHHILTNPRLQVRFKTNRQGRLHVAYQQIKS
jgi:hypothetical protein